MEVNGFKGNEIICDAMRQVLDSCNFFLIFLIFFFFANGMRKYLFCPTTFSEGILYRKSNDTKGA